MKIPEGYILVKKQDWDRLQQQVIEMKQIIEVLTNRIIELEQRLHKNSSNSHKPPSSD
jgi:BMFP domain-containing protein YqiC